MLQKRTCRNEFSRITISLLSPEDILRMSHGEVFKTDTISYKNFAPVPHGLFCERIFGPTRNFKCACGKYEGSRSKGIICNQCGVMVTRKDVRRERWGHINLAVPVVNCLFFKQTSNKIAILLGMSSTDVNNIIYYRSYVILDPGVLKEEGYKQNQVLTDIEYTELCDKYYKPLDNEKNESSENRKNEYGFVIKTGGEAIYELLKNLNLDDLFVSLQNESRDCSRSRQKAIKTRLKLIKDFLESKKTVENKPEWMVFKVLPVLPPDLRPMMLVNGIVATVDLNELLRRIIIRNNRVKTLMEIDAPEIILNNEKRILQLAVDALIDNSKEESSNVNARHLKSLTEKIKGKEGRFRQNLLGKRVDYSGRSVITINPKLRIHECGLPKDMAAELFMPFIVRRLIDRGYCVNVTDAKDIIKQKKPIIYEILEKIITGYPVLLNRAPTLHKMSIQAFQPKLVEGEALELNPLVCAQFNADFDGDQLGVHIPLSNEAILEANVLMLSANNLLRSIDGEACFVPNREMVLGFYYLTMEEEGICSDCKGVFGTFQEVLIAFNNNVIGIHDKIKFKNKDSIIDTTVGRVIFNNVLPEDFGFINETVSNSKIKKIVNNLCWKYRSDYVVAVIDKLKDLGFAWGHKSGISFNIKDILEPSGKNEIISKALENVNSINEGFSIGALSDKERYNQTIDVWTKATSDVQKNLMDEFAKDENKFNSVYLMLKSGARGSEEQVRQLSGIRGLMARSQKDPVYDSPVIETPILSSFKEGLNAHEYFISTYGGRKGMIDTALKTANAGYLTRKLVDVVQSIVVQKEDCKTQKGYPVFKFNDNNDETYFLKTITGRISSFDIYNPITGEVIVHKNEEITPELAEVIDRCGISCVYVRSIFTCDCDYGVCARCYGKDLSSNTLIQTGEAVGIIAAQSIGEPGTQLTLDTFHAGGTAFGALLENSIISKFDGIIHYENFQAVESEGKTVIVSKFCEASICDKDLNIVLVKYNIPYGSNLFFKEGEDVKKGDKLFDWDQYFYNILAKISGTVIFENFKDNVVLKEIQNAGRKEIVIQKIYNKNSSFITITDSKGKIVRYNINEKEHILVNEKQKVKIGDPICRISRNINQSLDITGGLPRVTELLEAKQDINAAILSEIDGFVTFGEKTKRKLDVIVTDANNNISCTYSVPLSTDIIVQEGEFIKVGSPIKSGSVNVYEIFRTKGFYAAARYIIVELKKVYAQQGVFIDDKHFEMIVNQMFSMVEIIDAGDTDFISQDVISRKKFQEINNELFNKNIIIDRGDSMKYNLYQTIADNELILENIYLKNNGAKEIKVRKTVPATGKVVLRGISQVSLNTEGWISAASFQSTISVLSSAAISSTPDDLLGLKENLVVGHKIPCGTNFKEFVNQEKKGEEKIKDEKN